MGSFKVTVELPLLLAFFSFILTGAVNTNLVIYRTCYLIEGQNQTECALLGTVYNNETEKLEKLSEPEANIINLVKSTIESVFTIITCMFLGPWTDRFGRKPVILMCLSGFFISNLIMSLLSFFSNISPWYFIFASIPTLCTGGGATFLTVVISYITEITNTENRGMRMAILEATLAVGIFLGNISSSFILYSTNYSVVFFIAALCFLLGILSTVYLVPESIENRETEGKFRSFFQITNLTGMVKTTLKPRENYNRSIILMTIAISCLYIFIINGDSAVTFPFLRSKFNWTLTKYTLFSSVHNILWILGTIFGVYLLHKLLNVIESVLIMMGLLSMLNSVLLQAVAKSDWPIYTSGVVRCLGGVISPMLRSLVSKIAPTDEAGKIFSVIMVSEYVTSLGASPLYTTVYNSTLYKDPAIFNFMSAGFYAVDIILIVVIMYMEFKSPIKYLELTEEATEEIQDAIN